MRQSVSFLLDNAIMFSYFLLTQIATDHCFLLGVDPGDRLVSASRCTAPAGWPVPTLPGLAGRPHSRRRGSAAFSFLRSPFCCQSAHRTQLSGKHPLRKSLRQWPVPAFTATLRAGGKLPGLVRRAGTFSRSGIHKIPPLPVTFLGPIFISSSFHCGQHNPSSAGSQSQVYSYRQFVQLFSIISTPSLSPDPEEESFRPPPGHATEPQASSGKWLS